MDVVTGKSTAIIGNPVQGASVKSEGTAPGACINDEEGFIPSNVPGDVFQVVSHLKSVQVRLLVPGSANITGVVVVEDATQERATITGSISTIKGAGRQQSAAVNCTIIPAGRLSVYGMTGDAPGR